MTAPNAPVPTIDAARLAALNDLVQLDHDAVQAYTLAIAALTNVGRRETIVRFRGDHQRHIDELTRAIQRHGGAPVAAPHVPTGAFKLAMQKLGTLGGDREVIAAFKTNERQARDKYVRAVTGAEALPPDVQRIVRAAAADEARHYEWASEQLESLGVAPHSVVGRVAGAVEGAHARVAEGIERAESRGARRVADLRRRAAAARERMPAPPSPRVLGVGVAAALVGFAMTTAIGAALRRR